MNAVPRHDGAIDRNSTEVGLDTARLERIDTHFTRYIDDGRLPGWQVLVARHGDVVYNRCRGWRDREAGAEFTPDTIVRLYSMTKPLTSVLAMMLHEEGRIGLKDPVSKYISEFADTAVYRSGSHLRPVTEPQVEPIRIWHLLTHMSGLTYGFHNTHPVDAMYRAAGFEWGSPAGADLAECCARWAQLPLVFQPGSEWNYGVSTDVLGRVVEVVEGRPLDEVMRDRITTPLGMVDTAFSVTDDERQGRLAQLYIPNPADLTAVAAPDVLARSTAPTMLSGGGGLFGTAQDYLQFCRMVAGGGSRGDVRLLGRHTVDYMGSNHLPGGADLEQVGRPLFAETSFDGVGFGLGYSIVVDPVANRVPSSVGEMAWGGAASTAFWIDPVEDLIVVFLTQLLPSSTHPIRPELKQLVYQALVD
ncbi:MAG: class A beta-lactamase-related serine hydrolase [Actinobacteria bacterium]|nr:class A beta-lactamase-related serine hydrolase [Actinomycetota bacterium]